MESYIWQQKGWPYLTWNNKELSYVLGDVRNRQGRLAGKASMLGSDLKKEALLSSITDDILKSSELENKVLDENSVRSTVASYLKINMPNPFSKNPLVEQTVNVAIEALSNYRQPVTEERIFKWKTAFGASNQHLSDTMGYKKACVNPTGSNIYAYNSFLIAEEIQRFIKWINTVHPIDPVIKAGIAHIRFLFINPFDEDNGQIARLLTDIFLARADNQSQRFFSMSAQIYKQKETYLQIISQANKDTKLDITDWLVWYLYCLENALLEAETSLTHILEKSKFWEKFRLMRLNDRQVKMINLLWDGTNKNLTSSYWANENFCSPDTALRDIQDLIDKKILFKKDRGGRSTSYELN
jgi:Fic family protein